MSENTSKIKSIFLKSLFILMILAIIVLLAFAVIRLVPFLFNSFASVGNSLKSPFAKEVQVELSKNDLDSEDSFRVYWEYETNEAGSYNLEYECSPNIKLFVVDEKTTELICNTGYKIPSTDEFIDLKAVSTKENFYGESVIEISYMDNNGIIISKGEEAFSVKNETTAPVNDLSGSATISSQNVDEGSNSNNDSNTSDTTTNSNSGNSSNNNSGSGSVSTNNNVSSNIPADLAVVNVRAISNTQIVFDVTNSGGRSTGNWNFSYSLPGEEIQTSPLQQSLAPGNTVRYTLSFLDIDSANIVIFADPNNLISENSEINNLRTVFIQGDGGSNNSNNNSYNRNDDADLEIEDLEVGYMDGSRFREDDEIDDNDDAAIRFRVINRGGESTGSWRFEIDETPYDGNNNDYRSGRQDSLRPGESTTIIVEFENPDEGRYNIEVTVDSDDDVDEENERNNDEKKDLRVRD